VSRLIANTSANQKSQRTLVQWLRAEFEIEKPSNKLLALTELDPALWSAK
jgi:hypothetical protein